MNLTIRTHSSTWKNARNRYVVGIGGVAIAVTVAIAGISALPSKDSRQASVTPSIQSNPSTLFQTSADAVFAVESGVAVTPLFASTVDAAEASVALALAHQPTASAHEAYPGLGRPGERSAFNAGLENVAAGEAMAYGVYDARPVITSFGPEDALGLGQPGAGPAPQFATMADAVSVLEQMLVVAAGDKQSHIESQFPSTVDAWEASIAQ